MTNPLITQLEQQVQYLTTALDALRAAEGIGGSSVYRRSAPGKRTSVTADPERSARMKAAWERRKAGEAALVKPSTPAPEPAPKPTKESKPESDKKSKAN